ncbi:flagellar basal body rod protein FlgC [Alteromonadaceae bacterium M269]|nr:flagellar basal body rod protein FlgC [Alteromonadaceae bacterium M269]
MSLFNILDIASTGMSAENIRLNTIASNVANANTVSSSIDETYRARHAVFATELQHETARQSGAGVKVLGIVESNKPLQIEYSPGHPSADENGYIYRPNINVVESIADLTSASKSYETNVQVADTTKRIFRRVLQLGQGR